MPQPIYHYSLTDVRKVVKKIREHGRQLHRSQSRGPTWQIETHDLTELSVVRVHKGDPVSVTVDAINGLKLSGAVARIGQFGKNRRGDVTYTVFINLNDYDSTITKTQRIRRTPALEYDSKSNYRAEIALLKSCASAVRDIYCQGVNPITDVEARDGRHRRP